MFDIHEIASILQATVKGPKKEYMVERLLTDSRRAYKIERALFFAIHGKNHNGHNHISDLNKRGLKAFIIEEELNNYEDDAYYIKVSSSVAALQKIASYRRDQFGFPLLAITGSNGKTVVKEWVHQLCSEEMNISRSPRSYNSQIGVPLSLWSFRAKSELGLVETGISKPGEMAVLEALIQPEMGMITNIGEAHAINFESIDQKLDEKLQLFKNSNAIFYCKDHQAIHKKLKQKYSDKNLISWSANGDAFISLRGVQKKGAGVIMNIEHESKLYEAEIPFNDPASVENFMHCFTFAAYMEFDLNELCDRAKKLSVVSMRSEILRGQNNCLLINDSYSADWHSLVNAVEILRSQSAYPQKTLILSDLELNDDDKISTYKDIAELLRVNQIDRLIAIGPNIKSCEGLFDLDQRRFFPDTNAFLEALNSSDFRNEAVLIKGARAFNLEKIAKLLQEKSHSVELEIRLNSLKHNLEVYRGMLKPETKAMAMVKAFGYGTGDYELAHKLQQSGIDYLAVAFTDEAVALRKKGISVPILVLNPERAGYESLIKHKLEPEIYSFDMLIEFNEFLSESHMTEELPYPIHINLDTGMHRLGFEEDHLATLIQFLKEQSSIRVKSIFTHLSSADMEEGRSFSLEQIEKFNSMFDQITSQLLYKPMKHVLNSAGLENFPEHQYDMVRLGIGLYGVSGRVDVQKKLEQVASLRARVLQIKRLKKGEPVGYSRAFVADRNTSIATISLGYADGLNRSLSRGVGALYIHGKRCPIVGNICMDMTMIDIADLNVKPGDEVEIFGNNISLSELANKMGTIPYEALSSVASRVKRIYSDE